MCDTFIHICHIHVSILTWVNMLYRIKVTVTNEIEKSASVMAGTTYTKMKAQVTYKYLQHVLESTAKKKNAKETSCVQMLLV